MWFKFELVCFSIKATSDQKQRIKTHHITMATDNNNNSNFDIGTPKIKSIKNMWGITLFFLFFIRFCPNISSSQFCHRTTIWHSYFSLRLKYPNILSSSYIWAILPRAGKVCDLWSKKRNTFCFVETKLHFQISLLNSLWKPNNPFVMHNI